MVEQFGCCLDANLRGESLKKIKTKYSFYIHTIEFLNLELHRMLCKPLIQPHLDYAYIS